MLAPAGFEAHLKSISGALGASQDTLQLSLKALEELIAEVGGLAAAELGPSLLSGTWVF